MHTGLFSIMQRKRFALLSISLSSTRRSLCTATAVANEPCSITHIFSELTTLCEIPPSGLTADHRVAGKRALTNYSSLVKDSSLTSAPDALDAHSLKSGLNATALLKGLSLFDPDGSFKLLLEHLERCAWLCGQEWTGTQLVLMIRCAAKIETTAVAGLLVSILWLVIRSISTMTAEEIGVVAKTYAAFGIAHPLLSRNILQRTKEIIPETDLEEISGILPFLMEGCAGTTTTTQDLIQLIYPKLDACAATLSPCALAKCYPLLKRPTSSSSSAGGDAPPTTEDLTVAAVLQKMNQRVAEVVVTCELPELIELFQSLSNALDSATFSDLFQAHFVPRILVYKASLLPDHITSILSCCHAHTVMNEDVFAALAERSCRVVPLFQVNNMATLLHIFASYDLYDPELYPLIAARIQHMTRQKIILEPEHIVMILAAFAKMGEKNDVLLFSVSAQLKVTLPSLTTEIAQSALASFRTLQFNQQDIITSLESRMVGKKE